MQFGEVIRREAFNTLDAVKGGELEKLKETNMSEIVNGVTEEYAARRTKAIINYAVKNCAFYRALPHLDSLIDFPVQDKSDYIAHYEGVFSDEFRDHRDCLVNLSTSGSTGTPFVIPADPEKMNHVNMNFMSVMELNGFRLGMKRGEFRAWIPGKNTITSWKSFKNNLKMIDISNMSDANLQSICDRIKRERIQVLVIYSSALTAISEYIKKKQIDTRPWDVEMIFTMGEALPEKTRALASEVFHTVPVKSYGSNENGFVAVSLPGDDDYTVDLYHYHVETLKMDSDEPAGEGELGRIIVTDYYNRAFPMIRYDTGDTGKLVTFRDTNGRLHAKFSEIYGRRGSMLYNTKGEPLSIHVFMNILLNFENEIRQAKCVQTGVKTYELYVNPTKNCPKDDVILKAYKKYLGEDADIRLMYVNEIPILASGKTMVCENHCEKYVGKSISDNSSDRN